MATNKNKSRQLCFGIGNPSISSGQEGVSLIITFFIMIIILAIVLSISILLYSEVKVIRNIGNSVAAFYLADSGAEKVLYYDRQVVPEGAARGICDICSSCGTSCSDCSATPPNSANGCINCTDCQIAFTTTIDDSKKFYHVSAGISTSQPEGAVCPASIGDVESYGTYQNTSRAIRLDITGEVKTGFGPGLDSSGTTFETVGQNEQIKVSVFSTATNISTITAYIYYSPTGAGGTYTLVDQGDLSYVPGHHAWEKTFTEHYIGYYYVSIGAINADGFCSSITIEKP